MLQNEHVLADSVEHLLKASTGSDAKRKLRPTEYLIKDHELINNSN